MGYDPLSKENGTEENERVKKNYDAVRKWTRKVDIFEKDFLFFPINIYAHWLLVIVCFPGQHAQNPNKPPLPEEFKKRWREEKEKKKLEEMRKKSEANKLKREQERQRAGKQTRKSPRVTETTQQDVIVVQDDSHGENTEIEEEPDDAMDVEIEIDVIGVEPDNVVKTETEGNEKGEDEGEIEEEEQQQEAEGNHEEDDDFHQESKPTILVLDSM
eukprot:TRINITY_DN9059_c0_g1_i1.p2 TRINITY_DN9059_c0_g1~~TRINITY_DN9059_c0_g1_i1.p2  ORF type:complete len:215 (-),score=86.40 TRINITY_DN9059_c0_g1_i1:1246-1890(-)